MTLKRLIYAFKQYFNQMIYRVHRSNHSSAFLKKKHERNYFLCSAQILDDLSTKKGLQTVDAVPDRLKAE